MMTFCRCPRDVDGVVRHVPPCGLAEINAPEVGRITPLTSGAPYACPVCQGRTTVPAGFYEPSSTDSTTARVTCRSCNGTGVLWSWGFPDRV